jgi:hypothetical protein
VTERSKRLLRFVLMGLGVGVVVGLNAGFAGLFRRHRTAVYVVVGVTVAVFVFVIEFRKNMKKAQKPPDTLP